MISAIEEAGLADNTVVMFVGDHGLHVRFYSLSFESKTHCYHSQVGEHSMWAKYTAFEIAHRAPMMIHVPGVIEQV